jgi:hypothetical protein
MAAPCSVCEHAASGTSRPITKINFFIVSTSRGQFLSLTSPDNVRKQDSIRARANQWQPANEWRLNAIPASETPCEG